MSNKIAKTPKPSSTELLNLAARIDTLADSFKQYGMAQQCLKGASSSIRSAVGHAMQEIQDEEIVVDEENEE